MGITLVTYCRGINCICDTRSIPLTNKQAPFVHQESDIDLISHTLTRGLEWKQTPYDRNFLRRNVLRPSLSKNIINVQPKDSLVCRSPPSRGVQGAVPPNSGHLAVSWKSEDQRCGATDPCQGSAMTGRIAAAAV